MLILGIAVAAIAAFILSSVYYVVMASGETEGRDSRPKAWQIAIEIVRSLLVTALIAGLMLAAGWSGPGAGALLGAALWVLPVVLLAGSSLWEGVPVRTAALHAGDWLIKLLAMGAIVGLFA